MKMRCVLSARATALVALAAIGCATPPPAVPPPPEPPPDSGEAANPGAAAPRARLDAVPRLALNRIAQELNLPLFWVADENRSGAVDPGEVASLWGVAPPARWVEGGSFTPAFRAAFDAIARVNADGYQRRGLDDPEWRRRETVLFELAQGQPSIVRSDFRSASAEDRALVRHIVAAAEIIERLYLKQRGVADMPAKIPADDPASRTLFWRNQGPWCALPKTERTPDCSGLPGRPPRVSGLYPASLQQAPNFCETLEARPDQAALLNPFAVVVEEGGKLRAVPYHEAYKPEMEAVSRELRAAAAAIQSPGESPLKAYLAAAAQAFVDGSWHAADEAWAKMNAENSRWYLRIGPDETYADPCARKAGFHVSFARINQESLSWQRKLDPIKNDMEGALAKVAGAPYKARKVAFHLPDFIDIVLNAGDSRSPVGGTVGQSLPNWGPVANEGRGRTVAMTNLFEDEDSRAATRAMVESLVCKASLPLVSLDPALGTISTVLHEAAHNLGPSHEYRVNGKTDEESFGGGLAATLEELKAQTAALYFATWLVDRKVIDRQTADRSLARNIVWAFGHIAEGMVTPDGKPKPYSQLASIQVASLLEAKAMEWKAGETASNGKDQGCFEMHIQKFPAAVDALARAVFGIKARGDKTEALKMRAAYVDREGEWKALRAVIQERALRNPKGTLVYSVTLE